MTKNVSIIIVNYNTKRLLQDCLQSVIKYTQNISYEIIVVDNASNDDSCLMIRQNFPMVNLVRSSENIGFGRANNLGAKESLGKYLFLLNSDTILKNNAVKLFFDFMEEDTTNRIGAVGCNLQKIDGTGNSSFGVFPSIQSEINYLWMKINPKLRDTMKFPLEVDYIIGADMFTSKWVFDSLKGFDEDYFLYYEETDLQKRMANEGLKRIIIDTPQIIHLDGGSFDSNGLSYNRFVLSQKSFNIYINKHYKGIHWIAFKITMCILRITLFFTKWSLKEKFNAYKLVIN